MESWSCCCYRCYSNSATTAVTAAAGAAATTTRATTIAATAAVVAELLGVDFAGAAVWKAFSSSDRDGETTSQLESWSFCHVTLTM